MTPRLGAVLALGWIVVAALAGCGSDEPDSATSPAATSPAVPSVTSSVPATSASPTGSPSQPTSTRPAAAFTIRSPDFAPNGPIPTLFTCDGANISPALRWSGLPAGTAALALVMDDPEATTGTFTHWVVVGISPSVTGSAQGRPPTGGQEITNDTGNPAYFGPCPPSGTHHYRFTLYALPDPLGLASGASLPDVLSAIRTAASAQTRVVGTYQR